jgi:flavin-dependent dehydrogenase
MKTDVAIVGGGPGGATLGMYLAQEGIQSVIIEKETFPRYHIGESMTGEAGGLLRSFGLEPEMLRRKYPIKHGVMVYGPTGKTKWYVPVMRRNEENELEPVDTWQVRRSTFDKMLLEEAVARGATLVHGQALTPLFNNNGAISGVQVKMADGGTQEIKAEVLVDASGLAQWLSHLGVASKRVIGKYDKQVAIFSQIAGACRDGGQTPGDTGDVLV